MQKEKLQCTYRRPVNVLAMGIATAFFAGTVWALTELKDIRFGVVTVAAFLCTMYLGLRLANQRVVLAKELLITYSIWNKKTEYNIGDITKIVVANQSRTKYIKIYFADKEILVRADIKNYNEFLEMICNRLKIKGYTRGGVSEFVIK